MLFEQLRVLLLLLLVRFQTQTVLLSHLLQRLHLCLEAVKLLHLLLLDMGRFSFFLLQLVESFVQICQPAGTVIDLLDGIWLIALLGQLIQAVLSFRLIGMEVFTDLVLTSDLGLGVLQLLFEVD